MTAKGSGVSNVKTALYISCVAAVHQLQHQGYWSASVFFLELSVFTLSSLAEHKRAC